MCRHSNFKRQLIDTLKFFVYFRFLTIPFSLTSLAVLWLTPIVTVLLVLNQIEDTYSPSYFLYITTAIIAAVLCYYMHPIFLRSLLRLMPLRLDRRKSFISLLVLWILPTIIMLSALLIERIILINLPTPFGGVRPLPIAVKFFWFLIPIAVLVSTYQAVLYITKLHRNQNLLFDRPFVLFLRRFSSFADRVGVEGILRSLPANLPLVFLVPKPSSSRDWNPWMIGLSGLKLWKRRNVLAIFLTADHDTWKESVQKLIKSARLIVIDTTTQSNAINWELNELAQNSRLPDTILIQEKTHKTIRREYDAKNLIIYKKSCCKPYQES